MGSGGTSNTGTGGRGRGHSNRSKGQSLGRRPRGSGTAGYVEGLAVSIHVDQLMSHCTCSCMPGFRDQRRSRMKDKEKSIPQNNHTKGELQ